MNICRNIWFSLASAAIISACIFLFCVFYSIITNVQYMVVTAESTMGITVFFDESLPEDEIHAIGEEIRKAQGPIIKDMKFTSAEEAWESFKKEYFGENSDLAEGFSDDNPLTGSASYEIYLYDINDQEPVVKYLEGLSGVRKVNFNKVLALLFGAIILMLLAVAVFLISNTISVAAGMRKNENKIMRLIGATNFMIRAPFVVEGTILGLLGAAIPLGAMYFGYRQTVTYVVGRFQILSGIIQFLPIEEIYPSMAAISLALGGGLGLVVSFLTIRRHLKV